MIKPSDIATLARPKHTEEQLASLEQQFDAAIEYAARTDEWPALVANNRDAMPYEAVELMASRYREAGWAVNTGHRGHRATIDKPDPRVIR